MGNQPRFVFELLAVKKQKNPEAGRATGFYFIHQ
jgi:hypothetical protein